MVVSPQWGDSNRADAYLPAMPSNPELKRLAWRAHHRGTREADLLIGGFFDAHYASWSADACALFDEMLSEQDVDIMAWAHGTAEAPERFAGPMIEALQKLDYIPVAR
jgi:antitoxin CptB